MPCKIDTDTTALMQNKVSDSFYAVWEITYENVKSALPNCRFHVSRFNQLQVGNVQEKTASTCIDIFFLPLFPDQDSISLLFTWCLLYELL